MNSEQAFSNLLDAVRDVHVHHPELSAFAEFPDPVPVQELMPFHAACADTYMNDTGLLPGRYDALQKAIKVAGPYAQWRETYKDTAIGDDFLSKFACYCIIGEGGPFALTTMSLYMVYMPPGLYYPWHHHMAEEIYFVVSGSGVFMRAGMEDMILGEGDTCFHKSNQPHALKTEDSPVLCLVAWRNHFDKKPVLTEGL